MKQLLKILLGYVNSLAVCIGRLFGRIDGELYILLALMALDIVSGIACAALQKSRNTRHGAFLSKTMFRGLFKKLLILMLVTLCGLMDSYLKLAPLIRSLAIGFYIAGEALSVVENAALLGVPFPKGLRQMLEILKEKKDTENPKKEA